MPQSDLCFCQGVVAPKRGVDCPVIGEKYGGASNLWYTDDPDPLTKRTNWTPEKLDQLLGRVDYCSKLIYTFYQISLYIHEVFLASNYSFNTHML